MKIHYKIASCSSQSPSNPVINLISGIGHWQSARFCSYPQQITLAFYEPVIINSIKITVHPHKVPQKINIVYHLPTQNNSDEFSKLGFIKLNPPRDGGNTKEQNNFESKNFLRQMKMIKNLNFNALYLRLIIAQNYPSKVNLFNQIGIWQIQIHGTSCEPIFSRVQLKNDSFVLINKIGKQKMSLLTQFKQKCIEKQQYNEAQQIKQIVNQINSILSQIRLLNQQKIKCVQQENYASAKQIKLQITKLRDKIQHMADHFHDPQKKVINKFEFSSNRNKIPSIRTSQEENNFGNEFLKNEEIPNQNNQQTKINEKLRQQQVQKEEEEEANYKQEKNKIVEYEQQVVPALLNKLNKSSSLQNIVDANQSRIQQNLPEEPEQLSPSNEANSSILTEFYLKLTIRKLHSKYWQFKSQALQEILNDINKQANSLVNKNKLRAFLFVYNLIMSRQNNKQLILSSLQLLNFISGLKLAQKDFKIQLSRQLQKSIILTLQKTQQNQNPKVKMQAQKAIIRMIQSQVYGCGLIYNAIVKNFYEKMSSKLKKVYMETLQSAVSNSKNIKNEIPISIVNFAVKRLEDANKDVRKSSINLLKALKHQGYQDQIKNSLSESKKYKQSLVKQLNFE